MSPPAVLAQQHGCARSLRHIIRMAYKTPRPFQHQNLQNSGVSRLRSQATDPLDLDSHPSYCPSRSNLSSGSIYSNLDRNTESTHARHAAVLACLAPVCGGFGWWDPLTEVDPTTRNRHKPICPCFPPTVLQTNGTAQLTRAQCGECGVVGSGRIFWRAEGASRWAARII